MFRGKINMDYLTLWLTLGRWENGLSWRVSPEFGGYFVKGGVGEVVLASK